MTLGLGLVRLTTVTAFRVKESLHRYRLRHPAGNQMVSDPILGFAGELAEESNDLKLLIKALNTF